MKDSTLPSTNNFMKLRVSPFVPMMVLTGTVAGIIGRPGLMTWPMKGTSGNFIPQKTFFRSEGAFIIVCETTNAFISYVQRRTWRTRALENYSRKHATEQNNVPKPCVAIATGNIGSNNIDLKLAGCYHSGWQRKMLSTTCQFWTLNDWKWYVDCDA